MRPHQNWQASPDASERGLKIDNNLYHFWFKPVAHPRAAPGVPGGLVRRTWLAPGLNRWGLFHGTMTCMTAMQPTHGTQPGNRIDAPAMLPAIASQARPDEPPWPAQPQFAPMNRP